MRLRLLQEHKSIKQLPIAELPDFSIITGANGAGKTHFLEAILLKRISVEGIQASDIKYYNWSSLVTSDDGLILPRNIEAERNMACEIIANFCKAFKRNIINSIESRKVSVPDGPQPVVSDQVLSRVTAMPMPENEFLIKTDEELIAFTVAQVNKQFNTVLENALQTGQGNIYYSDENNNHLGQNIGLEHAIALKRIVANSSKPFFLLTLDDCIKFYPLVESQQDPFIGSLTKLFAGYILAYTTNMMNTAIAAESIEPVTYLTREEFMKQHGPAPWHVFNQVLAEAKLGFRFNQPPLNPSRQIQVQLHHILSDLEIPFSQLSSGERVLISLAHFIFFSQDSRQPTAMPALILLDEVDAPLHPSMTADLLKTIINVIVGKYERKVILATHSPSTVALAPEECIHVMDVATKQLRKVTRDEGVRALTVGVPTLSINTANRRQVFVESHNDVLFYDILYQKISSYLAPEVSLSFISSGDSRTDKNGIKVSNCTQVINITHLLRDKGNNLVWGIIDWDTTNKETDSVKVLGNGKRYNIENYLLDPLLIAAFLLREKIILNVEFGLTQAESYNNLLSWDTSRMQLISDWVTEQVAKKKGVTDTNRVKVNLINTVQLEMPIWYLQFPGHDLEDVLIDVFPALGKIKKGKEELLKLDILTKVVDDFPGIVSADILETFRVIQSA